MDAADILIKCEVCGGKMKEPKILPCQHSFCLSCLKDRVMKDKENKLKCPRCFKECRESVDDLKTNTFIDLVLKFKTCGVCKKKETDFLCKDCDDFFCSGCVDVHNKLKVCDNHIVVKLSDVVKNQSKPGLFCIDCDQFLASESIDSHKKHEVTEQKEGIKRRLSKWEGQVKRLTESSIEFKECLKNEKYKWSDTRQELLELKSRLEDNYQELIEVLQNKKKLECDKIDAKVSSMEKEFLDQEKKITKEMLSFNAAISKTNDQIKNLKNGLEEGCRDETSSEVHQMHPPPPLNLKYQLFLKPIPKEAIFKLLPSIKGYLGTYELERTFNFGGRIRHDGKYLYDLYKDKIHVHSYDASKLLKAFKCPNGSEPLDVTCVNNKFHVIAYHQKKMLLADQTGVVSEDITLPSTGKYISNNGSNKIIITCRDDNKVVSYNADTRKIDTIPTPSVQEIGKCILMGGEEYCMLVRINNYWKIVKCVHGSITKSYDCGDSLGKDIFSNGRGGVVLWDKEKKMVIILDGDLEVVSSFLADIGFNQDNCISMDSEWNIYLSSAGTYTINKYKLI